MRGVAVGAGAWVVPSILTTTAAAAQTAAPCEGGISGTITICGNPVGQSDTFTVTAVQNPGSDSGGGSSDPSGFYFVDFLVPGLYDVTFTADFAPFGSETVQGFDLSICDGLLLDFDFTAHGC